jgi:hypothetical protein
MAMNENKGAHIGLSTILCSVEPAKGFLERVISRIDSARRQQARLRCAALSVSSFVFGILLVPLFQYAAQEFYTSGFYDYASLFFSDRTSIAASWQEFCMTLVESLPSAALLFLFVAIFALVWSLRRAIRQGRVAFSPLGNYAA